MNTDGMVPVSTTTACAGDLVAQIDEAIQAALRDVVNRPGITTARAVTVKLMITPDAEMENSMPEFSAQIGVVLPNVQSKKQRAIMDKSGVFYVNVIEEDPRQAELPNVINIGDREAAEG